jgi:hypothetical protein
LVHLGPEEPVELDVDKPRSYDQAAELAISSPRGRMDRANSRNPPVNHQKVALDLSAVDAQLSAAKRPRAWG